MFHVRCKVIHSSLSHCMFWRKKNSSFFFEDTWGRRTNILKTEVVKKQTYELHACYSKHRIEFINWKKKLIFQFFLRWSKVIRLSTLLPFPIRAFFYSHFHVELNSLRIYNKHSNSVDQKAEKQREKKSKKNSILARNARRCEKTQDFI